MQYPDNYSLSNEPWRGALPSELTVEELAWEAAHTSADVTVPLNNSTGEGSLMVHLAERLHTLGLKLLDTVRH